MAQRADAVLSLQGDLVELDPALKEHRRRALLAFDGLLLK